MHFPTLDDLERPLYFMHLNLKCICGLSAPKSAKGAPPDLLAGEESLDAASPKTSSPL